MKNEKSMAAIRLATTADAAEIAAIYAPYCESTVISFEEAAPSSEEMARRISTIGATWPWIVLESACGPSEARSGRASASGGGAPRASANEGTVVGYAYAAPHNERWAYRWSVNTAIYIRGTHHRRGAGRALYATLFEVLRHLGYYKAVAGITLPNPASVGLHEAMGFERVGVYREIGYKLGAWHDVGWYEAPIQPVPADPPEPRSLGALHGSTEWRAAVQRGLELYVHHT